MITALARRNLRREDGPGQSSMSNRSEQVTKLLRAMQGGDARAADLLLPLVYEELRSRAGALLARERRDHTLQRTALVHEAYLELVGVDLNYQGRLHFFNAAALAMRRILVRHALRRRCIKRGGGRSRVDLLDIDPADPASDPSADPMDWVELDDALKQLEQISPRRYQVVMLRFFSGRTELEIAQMLGVGEATVRRDWSAARIWLYELMQQDA
jgi:RNA polymerase sigma factor (TIGR02999 family)